MSGYRPLACSGSVNPGPGSRVGLHIEALPRDYQGMRRSANLSAEKLVGDYLARVLHAAQRVLPKGDRLLYVARTRATIMKKVGPLASADPVKVQEILTDLGDPRPWPSRNLSGWRPRTAAARPNPWGCGSRSRTSGNPPRPTRSRSPASPPRRRPPRRRLPPSRPPRRRLPPSRPPRRRLPPSRLPPSGPPPSGPPPSPAAGGLLGRGPTERGPTERGLLCRRLPPRGLRGRRLPPRRPRGGRRPGHRRRAAACSARRQRPASPVPPLAGSSSPGQFPVGQYPPGHPRPAAACRAPVPGIPAGPSQPPGPGEAWAISPA